jgi:hypothetical protein
MGNPYVLMFMAAIVYVVAVDESVAPFLSLQLKRLGLNFRRAFWMVRMHPSAPWTRWAINRRAWRLAEELQKTFNLPLEDRK